MHDHLHDHGHGLGDDHEHGTGPGHHGHGHGGPGSRGRFRGRARRGDTRVAILKVLLDGPGHGYEIIGRLEERSGGAWRPSPGSVYPTLQMLEEQGLLTSHEDGGKRIYELTETGRSEAESGPAEGGFPWDGEEDIRSFRSVRGSLQQLALAIKQVMATGEPELAERAAGILKEARQKLYQLLAES